jgi:hypothetical protein
VPRAQSPPTYRQYSFSASLSFVFSRLEFLSLKVAFYPETKQFMERGSLPGPVGAQLPLFLPIESQSDKARNALISFQKLTSVPILWNHRMRT